MGIKKEVMVLRGNERKNPKQKSMEDIKAKYGCQSVRTKTRSKISN